jgi:hypothetical protein
VPYKQSSLNFIGLAFPFMISVRFIVVFLRRPCLHTRAAGFERVSIIFLTRLSAACASLSTGNDDGDNANQWPRPADAFDAPQRQRAARLLAATHAVAAALLQRPSSSSFSAERPSSHSFAAAANTRKSSSREVAYGGGASASASASASDAAATAHRAEIESMSRRLAQMQSALADAQSQLQSQSKSASQSQASLVSTPPSVSAKPLKVKSPSSTSPVSSSSAAAVTPPAAKGKKSARSSQSPPSSAADQSSEASSVAPKSAALKRAKSTLSNAGRAD